VKATIKTDDGKLAVEATERLRTGRELLARGSCVRARNNFLRAIRLQPDSVQLHLALGQSFFFQRKPDLAKAIQAFRRAIELCPDWAEAYCWLGFAQQKNGKLRPAVVSFRRAIRLNPDDTRSWISLGVCLTRLRNYKEAITALRKGIALKPHYAAPSAHLFLADALRRHGKLSAARKEWQLIQTMPSGYPDYDHPAREAREMLTNYGGTARRERDAT
jgi:protein O-GlcNAc transferase